MQGQVSTCRDSPLFVTSSPPREAHNTVQEGSVLGFLQVGGGQRGEREISRTLAFSPACKKHTHTRGDANVTTQACRRMHKHAHTLAFCTYTLRLHWLISEADNTIPHVVRSIIVGQGLHYKASDCGLDGPLKGKEQSLPEPWKRGKAA